MLRAENISKSFGQLQVLKGLNVSIEAGEFFVILGPSGEGKSTFLNIIAGLLRPDSGTLYIGGELVEDSGQVHVPPERRGIGYVFQSYALYPHMTAYENIAFPLRMAKWGREEIDKAVKSVAELLNISEILHKKPHQLSGGQRQRVAVARAVVKNPRLLLMDEPFSNIDPSLREGVRVEIKRLVKKLGITTIMVTHDREEAFSMADRVAVLMGGRFAQVGRPDQVYKAPCCVKVAKFLGLNIVSTDGKMLAFRPEDVEVGDGNGEGEVVDVEFRGRYWVVYLNTGSGLVKATADAPVPPGARLKFRLKNAVELYE